MAIGGFFWLPRFDIAHSAQQKAAALLGVLALMSGSFWFGICAREYGAAPDEKKRVVVFIGGVMVASGLALISAAVGLALLSIISAIAIISLNIWVTYKSLKQKR